MYYLQTRYYDPQIGQFISPDSPEYLDLENLTGLNLYAYCGNNPVMNVDPTGTEWWKDLLLGLAIVAGTAITVAAIIASAGAVAALVGAGAAGLGLTASTVSAIASIATVGTYVVAGGVALFGASDAIEVWTGGHNPIRDTLMGGNQSAYNITHTVFDILGTIAIIAGAIGPKVLQNIAKGGIPKISNGEIVGYQKTFNDKAGNWSFRIDATTHGNSGSVSWHHNPHIHFLQPGSWGNAVYYVWEMLRRYI